MRRRGVLRSASLPFLIVLLAAVAGCGGGPAGMLGARDGPKEEASLGGAYVPAGFGEGSLWATDVFVCDDTGWAPSGGSAACGFGGTAQLLKRLDPETGEEVARVPLEGFFANTTKAAFGAGSVWVSSADYGPGPVEERQPYDAVYRIDPTKNRVVDRIPVDAPTGLAFGFGSVWVASAGHGTLSRIDPRTGEVAQTIGVGRVAVDERSGAVWVAGLYLPEDGDGGDPREDPGARKLSRVDPETMRVAAEVPIRAGSPVGGAQSVAVGEGAVWAASSDGVLLKVDPETNGVVASVALGDYSSDLEVVRGSVWVTGQNRSGNWLKRVDPRTLEVVWNRGLGAVGSGGYGRLAADGEATGRVWFVEGGWREGKGTLTRLDP